MKPGRKLVQQGAESLTDSELIALLIGSGCAGHSAEDIGRAVMERYGTLDKLMDQPLVEMAEIKGMGVTNTLRVAAAYELVRRIIKYLEQNG